MANALDRNLLKGDIVKVNGRELIVEGGYGLMASKMGSAIFGKWKDTGEDVIVHGSELDVE